MANLDIGRKTAGIPVEERMTIPPSEILAKARVNKKGKGKGKHVDVVETNQPSETASTVSYPSKDPSVIGELSCIKRGTVDHGCGSQFRVNRETSWCRVSAS